MLEHITRTLRARTISFNEARDIISEVIIHMEPRDKGRLLKEMYREISRFYNQNVNDYRREMDRYEFDMEIAKARIQTEMPIYKFRMKDGRVIDYQLERELMRTMKDQTSKELDELLKEQDFLSEQEMKI